MKNYNNTEMGGRLHSYSLELVETKKGEAIGGELVLETDANGTRVNHRFFAYPTYNSGKVNKSYAILEDIMAGNIPCVVDDGDEAAWYTFVGSIDVNYFMSKRGDAEVVRAQKVRGSFINANPEKKYKNKWKLDTIITSIREIDADEEKHLPRFVKVGGYFADDYNERLMGVQFEARAEGAVNYILGLDASIDQPYFVSTWGALEAVNRSIVRKNAFGEDETEEYSSIKWEIKGMSPEPFDISEESVLGMSTYQEFLEANKAHLEEIEKESGDAPDVAF